MSIFLIKLSNNIYRYKIINLNQLQKKRLISNQSLFILLKKGCEIPPIL